MGFFQDPLGWAKDNAVNVGLGVATGGLYTLNKALLYDAPNAVAKAVTPPPPPGPYQVNQGAADLNTTQADQARAQQQAFIQSLQAQANGSGPSVAQGQLQRSTDANIQQAMALGQSQRGVGYQAGLRGILEAQARAQQESAGQSALLRNQEMMQGQSMLGNALGGMRSQDIQQSGMGQQGNLGLEQLNQQNAFGYDKMKSDSDTASANRNAQIFGSILNAAGGAGAKIATGGAMAAGGPIPGHAKVSGDSLQNDTVPALLSPGEIVIPRSVAQSEDAPDRAAEFVAAIKAKNGKKDEGDGYGAVLAGQRAIEERLARIERMASGGMVR